MSVAKSILITGATSGIGRALAREYAKPGVHLALIGRDRKRLDEVAAEGRARGAIVSAATLDVRARHDLARWIRSIDDAAPLDLVIAGAGITTGIGIGRPREGADAVRAVIATNLMGVLNTIDPAIERMSARGRGRLAFLSTIAAVHGFPYSPAYCASKAAIHSYAEGIRAELLPHGVGVSIIVPGFVTTPLNRDIVCPKPFKTKPERAAQIIRRGLDRGRPVIAFPRLLYGAAYILKVLPTRWVDTFLNLIHVDIPETRERVSD
jgi:NAD(P)-dependent dehydrogenase (short-subunit alcohol dehydrogenase family)